MIAEKNIVKEKLNSLISIQNKFSTSYNYFLNYYLLNF